MQRNEAGEGIQVCRAGDSAHGAGTETLLPTTLAEDQHQGMGAHHHEQVHHVM